VFLSLGVLAGKYLAPHIFGSRIIWGIMAIFVFSTIAQHYFVTLPENQAPAKSVRIFMAASAIKLFIYLVLIVLCVLMFRGKTKMIVVSFLLFYMVFTAFENLLLYRHFRGGKNS
jgi:hypothetical protein